MDAEQVTVEDIADEDGYAFMGELGNLLIRQQPDLKRQVVAIDSIHVEDGEYVDMGKPMMNGMVIPVVVKTLIFG